MKIARVLIPVAIVGLGLAAAALLIKTRPAPKAEPRQEIVPVVRGVTAVETNYQFTVRSQGTVSPAMEIRLVAEVSGRVVEVAPSFADGGAFGKGDVLVRIDPRDSELALTRARADLARAEVGLQRELAEADAARREWARLGQGNATPLLLREPQLADARALVEAAEAAVEQSERDLARCSIEAPFAGRVWEKQVDPGQFVAKGAPLGRIYSTSHAEVRLPLPVDQLAYLNLPAPGKAPSKGTPNPAVVLKALIAGSAQQWRGEIIRTEAEINPRTRMIHVVAQVEKPYDEKLHGAGFPMAVGLFVEAEIRGRTAENVFLVPRRALRGESQLMVVTPEERLTFRDARVLWRDETNAVISAGIQHGETVCVSPLDIALEGMRVRLEQPKTSAAQ